MARLADLAARVPDRLLPPLDRRGVDETGLTADQRAWRRDGYVILPGFIPARLIDAYCRLRAGVSRPGGWESPTPYLHYPEIRDLGCYAPLSAKLKELLSEEMGMHLNLTGWVSTERNWHQDDYLNPSSVNSWYAAAWFALEDIDPDSGPFEFVPGSHRWPHVRGSKVRRRLSRSQRASAAWPKHSERILNGVFADEIARRRARPRRFLGKRGDVLLWHGRLAHRGSAPRVPGATRKAFIAHYSALTRRPDFPPPVRHGEAGWYFDFNFAETWKRYRALGR